MSNCIQHDQCPCINNLFRHLALCHRHLWVHYDWQVLYQQVGGIMTAPCITEHAAGMGCHHDSTMHH